MAARKIQVTISNIHPKKTETYLEIGFLQVWSIKMRLHWRSMALMQYHGIAEMVNGDVTEGT